MSDPMFEGPVFRVRRLFGWAWWGVSHFGVRRAHPGMAIRWTWAVGPFHFAWLRRDWREIVGKRYARPEEARR